MSEDMQISSDRIKLMQKNIGLFHQYNPTMLTDYNISYIELEKMLSMLGNLTEFLEKLSDSRAVCNDDFEWTWR